jgi:hypothetical protein
LQPPHGWSSIPPRCACRELRSSVAMMQATDHGLHNDATKPFDWSADRRILG